MAKITRYPGDLKAFASNATGTERTIFGSATQADDLASNVNADWLRGWGIIGAADVPSKQDFNAVAYTLGELLAYLHQMGIAEWHTSQEYPQHAICIASDGFVYRSLTASNVGNDPTSDAVNWRYMCNAAETTYDNSTSGLSATNVQDAIDEVSVGAGSARVELDSVSITATTSIDLPTIFSDNTDYEYIRIVVADYKVGTTNRALYMRTSIDGSTFENGASDYHASYQYLTGTTGWAGANGAAAQIQLDAAMLTSDTGHLVIDVWNPHATDHLAVFDSKATRDNTGAIHKSTGVGGYVAGLDDITGIQLFWESSASFVAQGTVKVYGSNVPF